jgi:GH18 family chitinase
MTHYQVPANKIAAGVAFYGRSAKTSGSPALFAPITGVDLITFGEDDGTPLYYNILKKQNQFSRLWDANAKVPYLVGNGSLNTFVSYDDEESIGLKAQYIKNKNLG